MSGSGKSRKVSTGATRRLSAHEANRRYFRSAYRTGEHGWAVGEPSPYAVRFLRRLSKQVPGGTLLDVGCGEGRHAIAAERLGFRVTAVDYEPLALKRAQSAAKEQRAKGIAFRTANVFALPFPDSHFDVVLDCGCLHHQRKADWAAYRANIVRVLKPGGFYVLSVFTPEFHLFRGSPRPWHIAGGAYRRCFTSDEIVQLFGRHFGVVEVREERGRGFWH